jgi:phosphinothricin acetyltransferase
MKTDELALSPAEARAVQMLRVLASPARFRIVALLAERKEAAAAQLADLLPLAASSLSEHLAALRAAGVIQASGNGPNRYFSLDPAALDFLAAYLSGLSQRARSWSELVQASQKEGTMRLRDATQEDAAAIARIHNQGIEDRSATLETQARTAAERADWLAARGPRHPVLVAIDEAGAVLGWGSLNPFNARAVYDHVADFSVYVARERRGQGIGDALLHALEGRAHALGYHKMVLAALPSNAPGMRLYERHGFALVGTYHEQGMLDGAWVDVVIMEKLFH